ncbi:RNA polymerase sigma factor [Egicoccus sp. AB-alg2]|uniref:RNA polymerase sigma factor n=1 Tax=Egicoccus sp. AB-alg2 TaxID=3242693 RepID=UPI00359E1A06
MDRAEVEALVRAAGTGDQGAYDRLVERFSGLVWAVVRSHRLADADAQDAFQTTWLRLVEHLDRLRDPRAVGGWLATTARHESLRLLRDADRVRPAEAEDLDRAQDVLPVGDEMILCDERDAELWSAVGELGQRCRSLLRVLMADPAPSYQEVAAALGIPIGSIGPTRGRCLERLRVSLRARGITAAYGHSG